MAYERKYSNMGKTCEDCGCSITHRPPRCIVCEKCRAERRLRRDRRWRGSTFTGRYGIACAGCGVSLADRPNAKWCRPCGRKADLARYKAANDRRAARRAAKRASEW